MKGESISLQVDQLLGEYCKELDENVDKAARGVASATANKLKKDSPRGKGKKHYADGWKSKRVSRRDYIAFNETKPGLTHLLNDGHAKSNGTGTVPGDNHIGQAADWAAEEFVKRVEKSI